MAARVKITGSGLRLMAVRVKVTGSELRLMAARVKVTGSGLRLMATRVKVTGSGLRLMAARVKVTGSGLKLMAARVKLPGPIRGSWRPAQNLPGATWGYGDPFLPLKALNRRLPCERPFEGVLRPSTRRGPEGTRPSQLPQENQCDENPIHPDILLGRSSPRGIPAKYPPRLTKSREQLRRAYSVSSSNRAVMFLTAPQRRKSLSICSALARSGSTRPDAMA